MDQWTENLKRPASEHFMPEIEYCRFRQISPRTAQRERAEGAGPPYVRAGKRCVVYCRSDVIGWLNRRRFSSAADESRQAPPALQAA